MNQRNLKKLSFILQTYFEPTIAKEIKKTYGNREVIKSVRNVAKKINFPLIAFLDAGSARSAFSFLWGGKKYVLKVVMNNHSEQHDYERETWHNSPKSVKLHLAKIYYDSETIIVMEYVKPTFRRDKDFDEEKTPILQKSALLSAIEHIATSRCEEYLEIRRQLGKRLTCKKKMVIYDYGM